MAQRQQQGIDSITSPTGLPTGIGLITVVAGAIWLTVRHRTTAARSLLFVPVMMIATLGDPLSHPVIAMLVGIIAATAVLGDN